MGSVTRSITFTSNLPFSACECRVPCYNSDSEALTQIGNAPAGWPRWRSKKTSPFVSVKSRSATLLQHLQVFMFLHM